VENISMIFYGLGTSLGLIAAIGSQNTFVIRQGLLKDRIFLVCSLCFLCDMMLINLGIFGLGEINSIRWRDDALLLCLAVI
jgi:L-lysine exporter family protein LysE/ArgO